MKRSTAILISLMMLFSYAGYSIAFSPTAYAGAVDESLTEPPYAASFALTSAELSYIPVTLPFSETTTLSDEDVRYWYVNGAYAKGYSFYADAGMEVTITMTSDDFEPWLFLLTEEELPFATDSVHKGLSAKIIVQLPYSGDYFVLAAQWTDFPPGDTGNFEISITVSEPDDTDGAVIQYTVLQNPYNLYFLAMNGNPRELESELEQEASAAYGMMRLGEYIHAPIEWRYDDFDSGAPGIGMIIGDVILPVGYTYEGGELTVEIPVLVYDPDGGPVEMVYDVLQDIFLSDQERILPLGMPPGDAEARLLSAISDTILMETADGYEFWAGVSVDASKVDTAAVGDYYPVIMHLPPGIGFSSDEYLRMETAVYVLDPDEVDLRAARLFWGGVTVNWLKEIHEPELWVSVDGGEWQNVLDGGDWVAGWTPFVHDFPGSSPYTELNISFLDLESGHIYDFEVRYEDGGVSVNILRIDLTGDRPQFNVYEGDRTGGDRYPNPWDVITGGNSSGDNGNGDSTTQQNESDNGSKDNENNNENVDSMTPPNESENGSSDNGNNNENGNANGSSTTLPDASENGKDQQSTDIGGEDQNSRQQPGGNDTDTEPNGTPNTGHNTSVAETNEYEADSLPQTPDPDADNNAQQQMAQAGNLILEPSNPLITASAGTQPDSGALSNGNSLISGPNIGNDGFYFDLDGDDKTMEITAPDVPQIPLPNILPESNMLAEQREAAPSLSVLPIVIGIIGIVSFGLWLTVFLRQRKVLAGR